MSELTEQKIQQVLQHPRVTAQRLQICEWVLMDYPFGRIDAVCRPDAGGAFNTFKSTMRHIGLIVLVGTEARAAYYCTSTSEYRNNRRRFYWLGVVRTLMAFAEERKQEATRKPVEVSGSGRGAS